MSAPRQPPLPTRAQLVHNIELLQQQLAKLDAGGGGRRSKKTAASPSKTGPLPPSLAACPKRHIAIKFAYDGWAHSGLAWQPPSGNTPFTTVEAEILDALVQNRLIEPLGENVYDGFGCGFERCGRTDAGVSSSAQVINLWVRSDLEDPMGIGLKYDFKGKGKQLDGGEEEGEKAVKKEGEVVDEESDRGRQAESGDGDLKAVRSRSTSPVRRKRPSPVEIPYVTILNKSLPPTIRILAWSPVSPTFSSRYSCIWRHYKYFFSTSPSAPFLRNTFDFGSSYFDSGKQAEWQRRLSRTDFQELELDVSLMQDAVKRLVGEHDFRNLCKIDPPKQLTSHVRTVISASIDPVEGEGDDLFVLNLRGSAFLYNQVRHILAVLFLVGARLETPDIIDRLLWTSDRTENTKAMQQATVIGDEELEHRELMDRKPGYGMADDLPLVLWQCGFNSTELDWRIDNAPTMSDPEPSSALAATIGEGEDDKLLGLHTTQRLATHPVDSFRRQFLEMNETWQDHRLKSIIVKHHLASMASHAPPHPSPDSPPRTPTKSTTRGNLSRRSARLFFTPHGSGRYTKTINYIPLLKRSRNDLPEDLNARWAKGRGQGRMEKRAARQEEADAERAVKLAIKAEAKRVALELEAEELERRKEQKGEDLEEVEADRAVGTSRGVARKVE
ncbi:pseudouridine synthase [Meredithblackwellia eburnea MCA 4105]